MMNSRRNTFIIMMAVLAVGCKATSEAPTKATRLYERQPIREVSEAQLALDARLIDALSLQQTGHDEEALSALASLTHDDPTQAAAWYEQGQLLAQKGWLDSALRCTERAVSLRDDNLWYRLAMAQLHGASGDARSLAADWERVVEMRPDVLDYYYRLSDAYLMGGDADKAVEVLNRVEKRVGVSEPVSLQKMRIWETVGQPAKAMHELEVLAEALPRETRYQSMLAQRYMQQKKYAKAKRYYDRVLQSAPDDEYIHVQLAEYYKQTGQSELADSEMVVAFANPNLASRTKLQLLASFYSSEEFYSTHSDVTFRLLEQTIREADDPREFALFYGDVLRRQERYSEAIEQFEIAVQYDSSRYDVWEMLLALLAGDSTREESMADYATRASRLFPMQTLPLYLQGLYHIRHERYAEALLPLEKANKWGFTKGYLESETVALMAEAYYRTGQYDRAWAAFERCLRIRPDDMGELNNYAYYLAMQGVQLDKALAMSRRTIEALPNDANCLDTYAWLLHLLGRDAEAVPYMRRAVQIEPTNDTFRRHLEQIEH